MQALLQRITRKKYLLIQASFVVPCTCCAAVNIGLPQYCSCIVRKKNNTKDFILKMSSMELHFCNAQLPMKKTHQTVTNSVK